MVPGCAGMVPGYAVTLRYGFSGVILGYGDVAKRFKFAVPHRGAWRVLNSFGVFAGVCRIAVPGGFPSLLPGGLRETDVLYRGYSVGCPRV